MRQLLIVNPNTTASVSDLLQFHAQKAAGPGVQVRTVTARFGAAYIACEASYTVAGHAVLDAWAAALAEGGPAPDAVLIGCFGDPGLMALRECSGSPVTGLAEAAFAEAASHGRFAIVTGGRRWKPMLERLAHTLGQGRALAGIHTVEPTGAQLSQDPIGAAALLGRACRQTLREFDVQAVILGGAGLAGMAAAVQSEVEIPVIDSVLAGTRQALSSAAACHPGATGRIDVRWQHVSPELAALGIRPD